MEERDTRPEDEDAEGHRRKGVAADEVEDDTEGHRRKGVAADEVEDDTEGAKRMP